MLCAHICKPILFLKLCSDWFMGRGILDKLCFGTKLIIEIHSGRNNHGVRRFSLSE